MKYFKFLPALFAAFINAGVMAQSLTVLWLVLTVFVAVFYLPVVFRPETPAHTKSGAAKVEIGENSGDVYVAEQMTINQAAAQPMPENRELSDAKVLTIGNPEDADHAVEWLQQLLPAKDRAIVSAAMMDAVIVDLTTTQKVTRENVAPSDVIETIRSRQSQRRLPFELQLFPRWVPIRTEDGSIATYVWASTMKGPNAGLGPQPSLKLAPHKVPEGIENPPPATITGGVTLERAPEPEPITWEHWLKGPSDQRGARAGYLMEMRPVGRELGSWRLAVPADEAARVLFAYVAPTNQHFETSRASQRPALPGMIDLSVWGANDGIGDNISLFVGFREPPTRLYLGNMQFMRELHIDSVQEWWSTLDVKGVAPLRTTQE